MQQLIWLWELSLRGVDFLGLVRKRCSMKFHEHVSLPPHVLFLDMVSMFVQFEIILSRMGLYGVYASMISPWDLVFMVWLVNTGVWGWIVNNIASGFCFTIIPRDGSNFFSFNVCCP